MYATDPELVAEKKLSFQISFLPIIFLVKSSLVRELTIECEKAVAGILITLEKPTKPMIQEAKQAGQFIGVTDNNWYRYLFTQSIQIKY
jgi:hypothetical protein